MGSESLDDFRYWDSYGESHPQHVESLDDFRYEESHMQHAESLDDFRYAFSSFFPIAP